MQISADYRFLAHSGFDAAGLEAVVERDQTMSSAARKKAKKAVLDELARHDEEEKRWKGLTDNDRLERAFTDLRQDGFIALQNCGHTAGNGNEIVAQRVCETAAQQAFGVYFSQSAAFATWQNGDPLSVFWGFFADDDVASDRELAACARTIIAALQRHGLKSKWSGKAVDPIQLRFTWQQRRVTVAPPRTARSAAKRLTLLERLRKSAPGQRRAPTAKSARWDDPHLDPKQSVVLGRKTFTSRALKDLARKLETQPTLRTIDLVVPSDFRSVNLLVPLTNAGFLKLVAERLVEGALVQQAHLWLSSAAMLNSMKEWKFDQSSIFLSAAFVWCQQLRWVAPQELATELPRFKEVRLRGAATALAAIAGERLDEKASKEAFEALIDFMTGAGRLIKFPQGRRDPWRVPKPNEVNRLLTRLGGKQWRSQVKGELPPELA